MTTRILPRDEWPKLKGTELETVWPMMDQDAAVVVVEDAGVIVGCWAAMRFWHAECVWIDEAKRKSPAVARNLLTAMMRVLHEKGAASAMTSSIDETVSQLVQGHMGGVKLPGDHFAFPVTVES